MGVGEYVNGLQSRPCVRIGMENSEWQSKSTENEAEVEESSTFKLFLLVSEEEGLNTEDVKGREEEGRDGFCLAPLWQSLPS
jgi:hypothetical protein